LNPHDIDGMARALSRALSMSATERRYRWNAMLERIESSGLDTWFSDFVEALSQARRRPRRAPIEVPSPALAGRRAELGASLSS